MERWRQASQDANESPLLTPREQRELKMLRAQYRRKIKLLQEGLRKEEKVLAEAATLLLITNKMKALWEVAVED